VVSYRQRLQTNGRFVEWRVENNSVAWVEPFAKSRTYLCADGSRNTLEQKTLGPYPPGNKRQEGFETEEFARTVTFNRSKLRLHCVQFRRLYETCGNSQNLMVDRTTFGDVPP